MHSEPPGLSSLPRQCPRYLAWTDVRTQHHITHGERNPFAGPISKRLWERAHSVPSQYHDTFDYGIYDRLYERFGDQQPRGGVVYKGTMKLLEAQDCAQCFHRFEIDTYGAAVCTTVPTAMPKAICRSAGTGMNPCPFRLTLPLSGTSSPPSLKQSKPSKFRAILERRVPCDWAPCPTLLCGWTRNTA